MTTSPRRAAAVLAVTGAALFMIVLDNLIVVSTLPAIQRSLDAPLSSLQWIVDAYILSFGVLILSGAALGERFGRRRMFVVALLLFSAASAAGALAPSLGVLIAAPPAQGRGGRDPAAAHAHAAARRLSGRGARARARHLVGDREHRGRRRPAGRRADRDRAVVALDLLDQRAARRRPRRGRTTGPRREPRRARADRPHRHRARERGSARD